ncbi:MFS transporter [Bartonella sp. LJL80]
MPLVIYIFSLCAFAIGFTEFITIGLTSAMAVDLNTDVSNIGFTVTAYALGVVIGAPILTALASKWRRKRLLLTAMLVFTASNIIAGFSEYLELLLIARLLSGLSHGVFFAVAASVASRLVSPSKSGSAIALVFGGITIAMSLGVPIGTWIGSILHWQLIFLIIAVCGLIGSVGIFTFMPHGAGDTETSNHERERHLKVLINKHLLAGASVPMLSFTGSFILYTFISPILLQITSMSVELASTTLLAYGIGSAVGTLTAGRLIDSKGMDYTSTLMVVCITVALLLTGFSENSTIAMFVMITLLGFATYGAIPPLQSRMIMLANRYAHVAIDVASGMNIAAFNTGVMTGSIIGGLLLRYTGLAFLSWVRTLISIISVFFLLWQVYHPSMKEDKICTDKMRN